MSFSAAASRRQPLVGSLSPAASRRRLPVCTTAINSNELQSEVRAYNCLRATTRNRLKVVFTAGIAVLSRTDRAAIVIRIATAITVFRRPFATKEEPTLVRLLLVYLTLEPVNS